MRLKWMDLITLRIFNLLEVANIALVYALIQVAAVCSDRSTCSTMEASRPSASPCPSSRVITALPNLITMRCKFGETLIIRLQQMFHRI